MDLVTYNSIRWRTIMGKSYEEIIYPSLAKKLEKKPFSDTSIEVKDAILTTDDFENMFLPIYKRIIVQRDTYTKDYDAFHSNIHTGIKKGIYKFMSASYKGECIGGIIYYRSDKTVFYAHRVFDRIVSLPLSLPLSIDIYMEKEFYDRRLRDGGKYLSHGVDSHPRTYGIGLILFKLKLGTLPMKYKKAHSIQVDLGSSELSCNEVLIFHNEDANGVFRAGTYLYKKGFEYNKDLIREMATIFEWVGSSFEVQEK